MPLPTILFVVFLVLKLMGIIDWSWVWVTAPLWGLLLFYAVYVGFFSTLYAVITAATRR